MELSLIDSGPARRFREKDGNILRDDDAADASSSIFRVVSALFFSGSFAIPLPDALSGGSPFGPDAERICFGFIPTTPSRGPYRSQMPRRCRNASQRGARRRSKAKAAAARLWGLE